MTQKDIDRMKEVQAVDILRALETRLGNSTLSAWRVNGAWRVSAFRLDGAEQLLLGAPTLLDALSQLAQVLTADDPGPYDHESDMREPAERVEL